MAQLALYFVLTFAVMSIGVGQEASGAEETKLEAMMDTLNAALDAGAPQREEPFELREFRPFLGDNWIGNGVAYGCYRKGQAPGVAGPSDAELLEDLQIITRHWNLIRVYGADSDTKRIVRIIDTHDLPIKVIQGIWLQAEDGDTSKRAGNLRQAALAIELAGRYPDVIAAISVANETQVFWSAHKMNPDELVRYIRLVRSNVRVPVTTADDYLYWNKSESKEIAEEIDFVFTHIHPLWNGKTLDEAMSWVDSIYHELVMMHPDRRIVIGETGWATDYNREETGPGKQGTLIKGDVGYDAQTAFLNQMNDWVDSTRVTTILFEAFDESWKGGGEDSPPNEVEKHWGVYNKDRTPKPSFTKFLESRK